MLSMCDTLLTRVREAHLAPFGIVVKAAIHPTHKDSKLSSVSTSQTGTPSREHQVIVCHTERREHRLVMQVVAD